MYFNIRYTTRAIAWAVATVAYAGPNLDLIRRYSIPNGQSAGFTDYAAIALYDFLSCLLGAYFAKLLDGFWREK